MNLGTTKPSIVIVSSSNTKPKSLIKLITRSAAIENANDPNIVSQEWVIDTKYYTANVNIFGITEEFSRTEDFNNCIEALIIHMDSNKESGLSDLVKWSSIENDCNIEVKLLVSNYFTSDTKISKTKATEWCLERGFELIELYPAADNCTDESDYNNVIKEKTGVDRIIEALQTHIWPNLDMKTKSNHDLGENSGKPESDTPACDKTLDDFLMKDAVDDFTELLSKLNMFKDSIGSMSINQRKQNAEQLVTKFWEAIGGDEEELADI